MQKRLPFAPVSVSFVQRMKPAQHPTALRTRQRLADAGLDACVVEFERPTRTSAEVAAGTPFSVFPLTPAQLQALAGAEWTDVEA